MAQLGLSSGLIQGLMNPTYTNRLSENIQQGMLMPHAAKQQYNQKMGMESLQAILNTGRADEQTLRSMQDVGRQTGMNPETVNEMIQQARANESRMKQEARAEEHAKLAQDNARLAKLRAETAERTERQKQQIAAGINRSYQGWKSDAEREEFLSTLDPEVAVAIRKHEESATTREYNEMLINKQKQKERPWTDAELDALDNADPEIKALTDAYRRMKESAPAGGMEGHNSRFEAQLEYVQRQKAIDLALKVPTQTEIEDMGAYIDQMASDTPLYDALPEESKRYVHSYFASKMKSGAMPQILNAENIERYAKIFHDTDPREMSKLEWLKQTIGEWFTRDTPAAPATPTGPQPGDEKGGYIFQGGDPSKPENWKRK